MGLQVNISLCNIRYSVIFKYALAALNSDQEGYKVYYAENRFDQPFLLDLIATHLVDLMAAQDFFGNPDILHNDLIGPAAKKRISALRLTGAVPIVKVTETRLRRSFQSVRCPFGH